MNAAISPTGRPDQAATVLHLVNAERHRHGLRALAANNRLARAAHYRAADMAHREYFAHTGWVRALRRFGYYKLSRTVGENIAKGQTSAREVFADWMDSPPHRANILASKYREMGLARCEDIWCQTFGARR